MSISAQFLPLFLIYTNYLEDDISNKVLTFAKDTKVLKRIHMIQINKVYRMI